MARKSTLIDITGQQFNRWKVLGRAPNRGRSVMWYCECQCDSKTIKSVSGGDLKNGHSKSCGCWKREVNVAKIKQYNKDMGFEEHPDGVNKRLYEIWVNMKKRCYNENHISYKDYGGRGIIVCDEWLNSYNTFEKWALSNGYSEELTLDRIDNDDVYAPFNCRWATYKEQANNKSNNRLMTLNGEVRTMAEWCELLDLHPSDVRSRVSRGASDEEALRPTPKGFKDN